MAFKDWRVRDFDSIVYLCKPEPGTRSILQASYILAPIVHLRRSPRFFPLSSRHSASVCRSLTVINLLLTSFTANARAQLLTVPPYAVCTVVLCITSYTSDRLQSRGPFVSMAACLGAIGYLLLLVVADNNHVRYFATFCITSGTYTVIGVVIAWCKCLQRKLWCVLLRRLSFSRP